MSADPVIDGTHESLLRLTQDIADLRRKHDLDIEHLGRDRNADTATLRVAIEVMRGAAWTALIWVAGVVLTAMALAVGIIQGQLTTLNAHIERHREQPAHLGSAALHAAAGSRLDVLTGDHKELSSKLESHRDLASHSGAAVQLSAAESRIGRLEMDIRNHKTALDDLQKMLSRVDANTSILLGPRSLLQPLLEGAP